VANGAFVRGGPDVSGTAITASGPIEIRVTALRPKFPDVFRLDRLLAVSVAGTPVAMHVVRGPWIQLQPLWLQPVLLIAAAGLPVYGALWGANALGLHPTLRVLMMFGLFALANRALGRSASATKRIHEQQR